MQREIDSLSLRAKAMESLIFQLESKGIFTDDFIDSGSFFFAIWDHSLRLLKINHRGAAILGLDKEESVGVYLDQISTNKEAISDICKRSQELLAGRVPQMNFESCFMARDLEMAYYSFEIQLIGKSFGLAEDLVLLVGTDITGLKNYVKEQIARQKAEAEQILLAKQLEVTASIQKMLIPGSSPKSSSGIDIFTFYRASTFCSGDFWLFKERDNRKIMILCDVQGHGVASAMLGSFINGYIQHRLFNTFEIDELFIRQLGEMVMELTRGEYATSFSALEINDDEIKFWNAGGMFPLLVDHTKSAKRLKLRSTILGVHDVEVCSISMPRRAVSRVIWHTDGFGDFFDGDTRFRSRQLETFTKELTILPLAQLNGRISTFLDEVSSQYEVIDDITLIALDF